MNVIQLQLNFTIQTIIHRCKAQVSQVGAKMKRTHPIISLTLHLDTFVITDIPLKYISMKLVIFN